MVAIRVQNLINFVAEVFSHSESSEEEARRMSIDSSVALMRALADEVAGFNIMSGGGPSLAIELALEFSRSLEDSGAR